MVTNLMLKNPLEIKDNWKGRFSVTRVVDGEIKMVDFSKKEVPFVIWRMDNYLELKENPNNLINTVKMMDTSLNIFEFYLSSKEENYCEYQVELIKGLSEQYGFKAIKFLRVDLDENLYNCIMRAINGNFNSDDNEMNMLTRIINICRNYGFEKLVITEKIDVLETESANKLVECLEKMLNIEVSLCCSFMSKANGGKRFNCLNAVYARELLAKYGDNDDPVLPTMNHQDMEECACMRFTPVTTENITYKEEVEKKEKSVSTEKKEKAPKKTKPKGVRNFNMLCR